MYLQMKRGTLPDSCGTPVIRAVFRSDRFIIKGHSLSGSMLLVKGAPATHYEKLEVKHNDKLKEKEADIMSRGPRPHRALEEAIPIAKARGIVQLAMSGPERIFDIAIISKIPVTFARVMFAPGILATIQQLADDFKEEIAQLRIIARDAAITAELWLRSKHGTWRFFLVTQNSLVEIDREGKLLQPGSGPALA
jgi:hypothetical protein